MRPVTFWNWCRVAVWCTVKLMGIDITTKAAFSGLPLERRDSKRENKIKISQISHSYILSILRGREKKKEIGQYI